VFTAKTFGKNRPSCAGTTGIDVDFNVAILWMKQKEILGSHFANAYECMKANELIESGLIRPRAVAHAGLRGRRRGAPADARKTKHLGKIAILVGADAEGPGQDRRGDHPRSHAEVGGLMAGTVIVPWYATGFRGNGFETALNEIAAVALRYGASLLRGVQGRVTTDTSFQQFRGLRGAPGLGALLGRARRWSTFRARHSSWYQVPVLYGWWDQTVGGRRRAGAAGQRPRQRRGRRRERVAPRFFRPTATANGVGVGESA